MSGGQLVSAGIERVELELPDRCATRMFCGSHGGSGRQVASWLSFQQEHPRYDLTPAHILRRRLPVEESLKAARVIHQIIIVAASAMVVFGISTRLPENKYSNALVELGLLEVTASDIDRVVFKDVEANYAKLLTSLREYDSDIQLHVRFSFEKVYRTSSLRDIRDSILSIVENLRERPNLPSRSMITEIGELIRTEPCEVVVEVDVIVEGGYRFACSDGRILLREKFKATHGAGMSSTEAVFRNLGLVTRRAAGVKVDVFPAMGAVWDSVAGLDPVSAAAALDRMARESAQSSSPKLTVLGLEMNASAAIVGGPAILVALLLYLYAHLLHIQAIAKGNEELLRDFRGSRCSTRASVWASPYRRSGCFLRWRRFGRYGSPV
jgi:hypothetical protein